MPNDYEVGFLLLDYLDLVGLVSSKQFSTHFTGRDFDSFVDFGASKSEAMLGNQVSIPMKRGFFYSAVPQGVRFGGTGSEKEYVLNGSEAVFTTGLSTSMVPSSVQEEFFKQLLDGIEAY